MEGFFNTLQNSVVDAVKDMATDALHMNDDKKENVESNPRRYDSSSSWGPTPQEAAYGEDQPEWRRPRPARDENDDETAQSEWPRPRPAGDDNETQPEWRRPRPEREDERPSEGNWAQVVGDGGDDHDQGGRRREDEGWQRTGGRKHRPHHRPNEEQAEEYGHEASEQHYAEEASVDVEPTEEELGDLSAACNRLWELDLNRLTPGQDYEIDCGEGKKLYNKEDMSGDSLFKFLDQGVFKRPTYARFYHLLDNYYADEGKREEHSATEEREQVAFVEEISRTAPIKYLLRYLSEKRIVSGSMEEFKQTLRSLWFRFYNRGGTRDASSAFEHVFVGEVKRQDQVSGFHNWIQFYVEEAKGTVDYQGYILPRRRGELPDSQTQLLTVQFEWNGVRKEQSSTLVGVSPEFELALYTLCFYVGQEDNYVDLGPYRVNVKCYHMGEDRIGSVFPIALD